MAGEVLDIRLLRLRIPGLDAEEGYGLGDEVARRIADGLSAGLRPQQLGALDLRVLLPTGTPRDRLALLIAEAVLGRLA
jgi:hypothetical protein